MHFQSLGSQLFPPSHSYNVAPFSHVYHHQLSSNEQNSFRYNFLLILKIKGFYFGSSFLLSNRQDLSRKDVNVKRKGYFFHVESVNLAPSHIFFIAKFFVLSVAISFALKPHFFLLSLFIYLLPVFLSFKRVVLIPKRG